MGVSAHGRILRQLLPPGRLFSRDPGSTLQALLDGLGGEFDRISDNAADLPRQVDPSEGDESLADWERVLGLPDDCGPTPVTILERRRAVLGRLTAGDNLSRAFYVQLARSQGYKVEIEELARAPFRTGSSRTGDSLGNEAGIFAWTAVVQVTNRQAFRAGRSRTGDPLGSLRDPMLECVLTRAIPAHTALSFRYEFADTIGDNGGITPIEDDCWWRVGLGASSKLRIFTEAGNVVIADEAGSPLIIPGSAESFTILDEQGLGLLVAISCEEVEETEDCYLPVGDGLGGVFQWLVQDDELALLTAEGPLTLSVSEGVVAVLDENGQVLQLPISCEEIEEVDDCYVPIETAASGVLEWRTQNGDLLASTDASTLRVGTNQEATVLDDLGNELSLQLVCGDIAERWLSILDPATGNQLNIQTIQGQLIATLEDGDRIAIAEPDQPFTVLDQDGNILTIPLLAAPV